MADSFFYWGVAKTYKYGVRVMSTSYQNVKPEIKAQIKRRQQK